MMEILDTLIRFAIFTIPLVAIILSSLHKPFDLKRILKFATLGLLISTIFAIPIGAFLQRHFCLEVESSCREQPGMLIPLTYSIFLSLISISLILLIHIVKSRLIKKW